MAFPGQHARRTTRRFAVAALAVSVLASITGPALAATEDEVDAAKDRVAELRREIESAADDLAALQSESAALADRLSVAEGETERLQVLLRGTRVAIQEARAEYEAVQERLDDRAHMTYMAGPGNALDVILGATSLADLSSRLEYVEALTQSDADLESEVLNVRARLEEQERRQAELIDERLEVVRGLRADEAELAARLDEQQALVAEIEARRREAEALARELSERYVQQVQQGFTGPIGDGALKVCPVAQPRAFGDDFGAPRYGGGYHPHAGNDIFAPTGTPIYAPFDGFASTSNNALGGLAVIVRGSEGWVYNAHLSSFGQLGSVRTGDVIGYVGSTGNASSPHNHFEWHPNATPNDWPESAYGFSVVGTAVNPRPLLLAVC
jgi:murein DD-endopeptidase MepM/ murein hydrolase activator NlpD